jgi:hypothetical protein
MLLALESAKSVNLLRSVLPPMQQQRSQKVRSGCSSILMMGEGTRKRHDNWETDAASSEGFLPQECVVSPLALSRPINLLRDNANNFYPPQVQIISHDIMKLDILFDTSSMELLQLSTLLRGVQHLSSVLLASPPPGVIAPEIRVGQVGGPLAVSPVINIATRLPQGAPTPEITVQVVVGHTGPSDIYGPTPSFIKKLGSRAKRLV